jgi:hypothetical protein
MFFYLWLRTFCGQEVSYFGMFFISEVLGVIHSSTVPVIHPFASCHEGPRFNPQGVLMWNQDSPFGVVLLHWWPWRDWSLLPRLRRALSRTVSRPSSQQCDNPTWSHTTLLSRFHAYCRSSFRLHNRHSRLLGGSPFKSLQSHFLEKKIPYCLETLTKFPNLIVCI